MRSSPKHPRGHGYLAVLAAALAATVMLSGCTGAQTPQPTASHTPRASHTALAGPQIPHESPGVVGATALPTDIPNTAALRSRVQMTSCAKAAGGWSAAGTAKNPGKKAASYTITVFFLAPAGTVLGFGQTTAHVGARKAVTWHVSDTFTAPANTRCSLRGVG